jgi:UDP-3-O-[3-hydroxymyristoyl] glucosamine N-acyltransferase
VSGWTRSLDEGTLTLEDWVQVGPQTIIERGSGESTMLKCGAMVGGQVYIGHGAHIGANSLIVAQSGIGGFTSIGEGATIMARVAVNSGAHIGRSAIVDGGSTVFTKVDACTHVFGTPARPRRQALRSLAATNEINRLKRRLAKLESALNGR